jgi:hypothetical protein
MEGPDKAQVLISQLNPQYTSYSKITYMVKMKYVPKTTIFGLKWYRKNVFESKRTKNAKL